MFVNYYKLYTSVMNIRQVSFCIENNFNNVFLQKNQKLKNKNKGRTLKYVNLQRHPLPVTKQQ